MGSVTPKILKLDLTANDPDNFIENETHSLTTIDSSPNRILIPRYGSFYRKGLLVRETSGTPLTYGKDYRFGKHEQEFSTLTGLDVESFIVITKTTVSNNITMTYRALGNESNVSHESLQELLELVRDSELIQDFKDIVGTPSGYPGDESHLHKYWQLYGFESLIENLTLLGTALGDNRRGLQSSGNEYSNIYLNLLNDVLVHYRSFIGHLSDYDNPHDTTAKHVGLEKVNNWRLASFDESKDRSINNLYIPLDGAISLIDTYLLPYLNAHLRDKSNPHNVTLKQLDLYDVSQIQQLYGQRLLRTNGAADSKLFDGKTLDRLITDTKTNLHASNVHPTTVFNRDRIAVTSGSIGDKVLIGNNTFKHIREIVNRPDLESSWVMLPGIVGSRALAWQSVVAANVPAHRIILKNYYVSTMIETLAAKRNVDGTTSPIFN